MRSQGLCVVRPKMMFTVDCVSLSMNSQVANLKRSEKGCLQMEKREEKVSGCPQVKMKFVAQEKKEDRGREG